MNSKNTKYPFFNLIESEEQAELALSALTYFGSQREKKFLSLKLWHYSKTLCAAMVL